MTFDLTTWNRIEPSARDPDLAASLSGRLADPLWMLARQWQSGELDGTDGGRPVTVRIATKTTPLAVWRPGDDDTQPVQGYDPRGAPLESRVEADHHAAGLWEAAVAGRRFVTMLGVAGFSKDAAAFAQRWSLPTEPSPGDATGGRLLGLLRHGLPDGAAMARDLRQALGPDGLGAWPDGGPDLGADLDSVRTNVVLPYLDWWEQRHPPDAIASDAWVPARQRYALTAATADDPQIVLTAGDHQGGALDWTAFSSDAGGQLSPPPNTNAPAVDTVRTLLPAPVQFKGAPSPRWWEIEDGAVALARVDAASDELAKLLFLEFTLIYGNDFFLVPLPLPVGSYTAVKSLLVTDGFGVRTLVDSTETVDGAAATWRLFAIAHQALDGAPGSAGFLDGRLLPAVPPGILQSEPVEDVRFVRDEQSALAWAVERRVPGAIGRGVDRAQLTHQQAAEAPVKRADADPAYTLARTPPDWWYPLLPEHLGVRQIALSLSRVAHAGGLQDAPQGRVLADPELVLDEQTVPRNGLRVVSRARMARGADGSRAAWLGREAGPGGGEGHSGLAFDDVQLPADES
ncbi:MAG: hypothetical protein ACJ780_26230 [Solirubrobacteraceae bacterium]